MDAVRTLIWENSYGSTSVDAICHKAGVRKGSFYHFFESKSTLATEALEADWQAKRAKLDEMFSPLVPPLDRLRNYFDYVFDRQAAAHAACGCVLGCPLLSLGCEVSTQDPLIRAKVQEILGRQLKYFETAVRDAHGEGSIVAPQARVKARSIYALLQGALTQARILDSLDILRDARSGVFDILGIPAMPVAVQAAPAPAAKRTHPVARRAPKLQPS
ncbi:MAG: TetR/AcrR family transcriptional regulator [Chthoniobacteraceae bacterium]|jgi:TetR/AcrR family transcriptional repressor of nem operon